MDSSLLNSPEMFKAVMNFKMSGLLFLKVMKCEMQGCVSSNGFFLTNSWSQLHRLQDGHICQGRLGWPPGRTLPETCKRSSSSGPLVPSTHLFHQRSCSTWFCKSKLSLLEQIIFVFAGLTRWADQGVPVQRTGCVQGCRTPPPPESHGGGHTWGYHAHHVQVGLTSSSKRKTRRASRTGSTQQSILKHHTQTHQRLKILNGISWQGLISSIK